MRFMRYLDASLKSPSTPSELRSHHVSGFQRYLEQTCNTATVTKFVHGVAATLDEAPLAGTIPESVRSLLRPRTRSKSAPAPGYSNRELKLIVSAARTDVAAIRTRLTARNPSEGAAESSLQTLLQTGSVDVAGVPFLDRMAYRRQLAEQVFVTKRDLVPMLVLLVAATGWNVETIKELPSEHRVIEGLAVEVEITKRRRGPGRWHSTATWEIGRPGQELRTPGGLYLLLHTLMAPARALLPDRPYWATWAGAGRSSPDGVRNPFAASLNSEERNRPWVERHNLRGDSPAADPASASGQPLLALSFPRLKTSIDVRRTRAMGGHLPSAARSNTIPVLFRNYLSGDPTTLDWAHDVMAEALSDVERSALEDHRRTINSMDRPQLDIRPASRSSQPPGPQLPSTGCVETPWSSCRDHNHHPLTGRRCSQSFLDCFHCSNSVITNEHLPRLLSLLHALERRRDQMTADGWWLRYGPTWTAIRYEVLPRFTAAEVEGAANSGSVDSLLDIVEPGWEHP